MRDHPSSLPVDEIRAFPALVDLRDAARALGLGYTLAGDMCRAGDFPIKVLKIGNRYRFRRHDLLEYLRITDTEEHASDSSDGQQEARGPVAGRLHFTIRGSIEFHEVPANAAARNLADPSAWPNTRTRR